MATSDPTALLAHTGWVRALAGRLCADPHLADDVAQDVALAALRTGPDRGSLRGWLSAVTRNALRQRVRGDGARTRRERARPAELAPATADVVARADLCRRVAEAVLALDEPYRRTLLSCFFDGEPQAVIARREGVPESTVRNRVRRGLDKLRADLDARSGGDARRWLLGIAVIRPRTAVLPAAIAKGVVMASAKVGLGAVAVAAVVAVAWIALAGDGADTPAGGTAPRAPATVAAPPLAPVRAAERTSLAPQPEEPAPAAAPQPAVEEPAAPPAGVLEVEVLRSGQPVGGGFVHVARTTWLPREPWRDDAVAHHALDASGRARIAGLASGALVVGIEPPLGVQRLLTMPEAEGLRVRFLLGGSSISGVITRDDGAPAAGARVQVGVAGRVASFQVIVFTGADGSYRVDGLSAGRYRVGVERSGRQNATALDLHTSVELDDGEVARVDLGGAGAGTWRGTVRDRAQRPVPGARLYFDRLDAEGVLHRTAGADGRFEVALPAGRWRVALASDLHRERRTVYADVTTDRRGRDEDLVLPGARVGGTVRGADGELLGAEAVRPLHIALRPAGAAYPSAFRDARIESDGTFAIDGVEAGRFEVVGTMLVPQATLVVVGEDDVDVRVELRASLQRR
jgi:RNA polymerase sigma-70 factor (ECF subfamily)